MGAVDDEHAVARPCVLHLTCQLLAIAQTEYAVFAIIVLADLHLNVFLVVVVGAQ